MDQKAGSSCNLISSEVGTTFTIDEGLLLCYEDH